MAEASGKVFQRPGVAEGLPHPQLGATMQPERVTSRWLSMWVEGFEFWVPGPSVGKGRARARRVKNFVQMYTPAKTVAAESGVRVLAKAAMAKAGFELCEGPVRVTLEGYRRPPRSASRKAAAALIGAAAWDTRKPDLDNVAKLVGDALNGVAWVDDSQVAEMQLAKRYGPVEGVRVAVAVWSGFT